MFTMPSLSQIATAVWDLVGVGNRTVTVTTNNDKTGYSLTAGSYAVLASSVQRGTITITSPNSAQTASVSTVTTTRTRCANLGTENAGNVASPMARVELVNGSNVEAFQVMGTDPVRSETVGYELVEFVS